MDPTLKSRTLARLKAELERFSPRMQLAAKYVLDNPGEFGLDPIRETARKAGVSTYTLVRMAEHLGFDGFEDFRAPFRHALLSGSASSDRAGWIAGLGARGEAGRFQADVSANALSIVERSLERLGPETLDRAAGILMSARRVYVTAVRASFAMAYYFHYVGRMAVPSLRLIPRHMGSAVDDLNEAGPEDAVLAITVAPYSRETIEACEFAQDKGLRLVLVADSDVVAPGLRPDAVMVVSTLSEHHFGCYSGVVAVLEVLLARLVRDGGAPARARIESYEALRARHNVYWSREKTRRIRRG